MRVLISGDFCDVNRGKAFTKHGDLYGCFGFLLNHINDCDLSIVNLEAPIGTNNINKSKTGPVLNSSCDTVEFLKNSGFKLLTLANNHILDHGLPGLNKTLEYSSFIGLNTTGAYLSMDEKYSVNYYEQDGLRLGILNVCDNEWSTINDEFGCNGYDDIQLYYTVQKSLDSCDKLFVIYHGGHENYNLPSPKHKKRCRYLIDLGADLVVCHHSHCTSGYEQYGKGYIFYGLGNLLFDNFGKGGENIGACLSLQLGRNSLHFDLIPFKQNSHDFAGITELSKLEKDKFLSTIDEINSIIKNDILLEQKFRDFLHYKERMYRGFLEPISIPIVATLQNREYLPSLTSRKKRRLLLNLMRCEAHYEAIVKILTKDLGNDCNT